MLGAVSDLVLEVRVLEIVSNLVLEVGIRLGKGLRVVSNLVLEVRVGD